ncbi:MAG TPA: hypothetical protein VHJ20_17020 [Polyangia bacterium]|nr:hypothetical protein [Polyangia bacterium]
MPLRPPRLFTAAVLVALAPLGACFVSGGDGTPSQIIGDEHRPGGYGGSWGNPPVRDGGLDVRSTDGGDGAATSPACTTGATSAFALAWTVSGATDAGPTDAATGDASGDGGASDAAVIEAGTTEAGATEAGATEAGVGDASAADANVSEAGASSCAAFGGKTVDVAVTNLVTGATSSTSVACDAMNVTTCSLPHGSYSITLDLRAPSGALLSEIVAPNLVVENGETSRVPSLPFEVGGIGATMGRGFALTWSIEDANTGAARTCAQAGAATVRLEASGKTFDLPCGPGFGRTAPLTAGEYSVKLSLLDAQNAPLSVTESMLLHIENGQLIFLGPAVFDVL